MFVRTYIRHICIKSLLNSFTDPCANVLIYHFKPNVNFFDGLTEGVTNPVKHKGDIYSQKSRGIRGVLDYNSLNSRKSDTGYSDNVTNVISRSETIPLVYPNKVTPMTKVRRRRLK